MYCLYYTHSRYKYSNEKEIVMEWPLTPKIDTRRHGPFEDLVTCDICFLPSLPCYIVTFFPQKDSDMGHGHFLKSTR